MPIPWKIANEEYLVRKTIQDLFQRFDCVTNSDAYDDTTTIRQAVDRALKHAQGGSSHDRKKSHVRKSMSQPAKATHVKVTIKDTDTEKECLEKMEDAIKPTPQSPTPTPEEEFTKPGEVGYTVTAYMALQAENAELRDLLKIIDRRLDIEAEESGHVKVFILAAHRNDIKKAIAKGGE